MRVHIEHQEKTIGLIGSRSQVEVTIYVEFSQEERVIIDRRDLRDFVVMERTPDSRLAAKLDSDGIDDAEFDFHLRIRDLMATAPDRFVLDTPSDAKAYQSRLTDALKQLKSFIMDNAAVSAPTDFEC